MNVVEQPGGVASRLNVRRFARRQIAERVCIAVGFAATLAFLALPSFGTFWGVLIAVGGLAAGAALAVLRYASAARNLEVDFDALREAAEESGGVTSPEERLQAFDSIRFLSGEGGEASADRRD